MSSASGLLQAAKTTASMFSIFGMDGAAEDESSILSEQSEQSEQPEQSEQSEQREQSEQSEQPEQSEQSEQSEQREQSEQSEQREQPEQPEQREQYEQREQPEQPEQREQYEQSEQREQYEQSEQSEQLIQFRQLIRLSSAFCAASCDPKYSTLHLLPLLSSSHVAIAFSSSEPSKAPARQALDLDHRFIASARLSQRTTPL
jgi:DNA mismatch repair ATPase MutL